MTLTDPGGECNCQGYFCTFEKPRKKCKHWWPPIQEAATSTASQGCRKHSHSPQWALHTTDLPSPKLSTLNTVRDAAPCPPLLWVHHPVQAGMAMGTSISVPPQAHTGPTHQNLWRARTPFEATHLQYPSVGKTSPGHFGAAQNAKARAMLMVMVKMRLAHL